jgi:hypothetical protein
MWPELGCNLTAFFYSSIAAILKAQERLGREFVSRLRATPTGLSAHFRRHNGSCVIEPAHRPPCAEPIDAKLIFALATSAWMQPVCRSVVALSHAPIQESGAYFQWHLTSFKHPNK